VDHDENQQLLDQLELYHRNVVNDQVSRLNAGQTKRPKVDHPFHLFRVKLLWKMSLGRNARSVKFNFNKKKLSLIVLPPLALILLFFIYSVFVPDNISYSFSGSSHCSPSPLLLPGLFARTQTGAFKLERSDFKVLGVSVYSGSVCAEPNTSPSPTTAYKGQEWLNIFGLKLAKTESIKTTNYVMANAPKLGASAIPIQKPLTINLNSRDQTFSYALSANNQLAPCVKKGSSLSCDLSPLKLSYGTGYKVSLDREFNNKVAGTLLTKNLQTITATGISNTSIAASSTVYDKPQSLTITTTKDLTKVGSVSLSYTANNQTTTVPTKTTFKGSVITVTWTEALPRQDNFDLHLAGVDAVDDSTLEQPFDLGFTTSGGPSVSGSNIPSFGLNSGQPMRLSFSQPLDPSQNIGSLANLEVNGQVVASSVTLTSNNVLTITPASGYSYPVCASVKVIVAGGVESNYDIAGSSAWSYSTRSHCYTVFSIGTSVQGRPITAYQFGSGPSSNMVLFIAAMEGNEQNSANLLAQWIPDIDANPGKIPANRTIVVIPQINPDGYAADTRLNAAGIDLNRNFPANNWSEQVTEPLSGNVWTNDGGPTPLSAPESQALANYYETNKPLLAITEHSHGGIVEANDAGDSIALGAEYAKLADYRAIPTYLIGNFFDYTTTGAFEDWANDKLGLPVLEVELQSLTNDEYSRNLPALWAMAEIPPN
jgi:protein MpaA